MVEAVELELAAALACSAAPHSWEAVVAAIALGTLQMRWGVPHLYLVILLVGVMVVLVAILQ
jgi:hypothetical protein